MHKFDSGELVIGVEDNLHDDHAMVRCFARQDFPGTCYWTTIFAAFAPPEILKDHKKQEDQRREVEAKLKAKQWAAEREALKGSTQIVWRSVWGCPANAPGTPVKGGIDREVTQIKEGQCIDFRVGSHVRVDDVNDEHSVVCIAPLGSIKPCQWVPASQLA